VFDRGLGAPGCAKALLLVEQVMRSQASRT
jgi:hypothetical protein